VHQTSIDIQTLAINTIRALAMDAVQQAESGHPGTPMALAPLAYALFTKHMKHDPTDPDWPDRDRFVLSAGHASLVLYSSLFLSGYDLTLDDIKQFRQWESRTPGHPEYGYTPGVETTTGPLGQGFGNAVGMAIAEAHLAAKFNRSDMPIVDHHTWFICSDGDIMEGVSHEVASIAGHFGLGKLIGFYDDNSITIDGRTELTFSDDTRRRFEGYNWQVLEIDDVNDLEQIDRAVEMAKLEVRRPTLVITKTHIGYGSPNRQDTAKAHGEPLGKDEVRLAKENLGWPSQEPFYVPEEAVAHWREQTLERGARAHEEWRQLLATYTKAHQVESAELTRRLRGDLPEGWDAKIPTFTKDNGSVATRAASGIVLNAIAPVLPELVGGSADLTGSNNTAIKGEQIFSRDNHGGRYIHFGVREHGMGTVMNGMALHGGFVPFGGTFLIFSDYMRPPIRLAAFMEQHVIYLYTHDSIGLGEDGPTHQPIEQLSALRAIPNITLIRPADASETAEAWRVAVKHTTGPVALVLTRQKLAFIDREVYGAASGLARGAYVLAAPGGGGRREGALPTPPPHSPLDVVMMSSGSEVGLILAAQQKLEAEGISASVVSMASHELFARQDAAYRDSVLPPGVPRIAIEAAHPMSWYRWVGTDGVVLGLERFGASAPYERIYEELGLTVDRLVETAKRLVRR
jgi:transketolase